MRLLWISTCDSRSANLGAEGGNTLLSEAALDQADVAIVPFLTSNPEQRIVTYVNDSSATVVSIGCELLAGLRDESLRTQWPVMISALADLLGDPFRAV